MELHSPTSAKKLWNFLRIAFFMMRKGLISKRKLVMDMNLLMKRGKIMGKSIGNLVFHHHHHHHRSSSGNGFSLQEYEFSCSNSPNPVFFHTKRRHNYFRCLSAIVEGDETPKPTFVVPRIEYSPVLSRELASGENKTRIQSPFSVRVSNYSSDTDMGEGFNSQEVDDEAEDFIKRFYDQLRLQSRISLIEYQETVYQEMIARGC